MLIEIEGHPDKFGDFICPFHGDRGNCQAIPNSQINHCPKTGDDEHGNFVQSIPDDCPLLSGDIAITLKK